MPGDPKKTALGELEDRATNLVTGALARSVEHVVGFFVMLRTETAFYVGCKNLSERLAEKASRRACRSRSPAASSRCRARGRKGIYDACLSLTVEQRVVGNDLAADRKSLVMITGANQGGKSTFLCSVGLAQLLMRCGMFVAGESLRANVCTRSSRTTSERRTQRCKRQTRRGAGQDE
jgi:DNA mismatch repair ATPase MutS